jgi:hypothetical protein
MAAQWASAQRLIKRSIDEGTVLVASGTGKPTGLEKG